ncbi:MAG: cation:proton antiporter [Candidatus Melainabacteria bacterium]
MHQPANQTLIALSLILLLGIGSQWVAWRTRLPTILILLFAGILSGPVLGWVDAKAMLGNLFTPIISLSVGIILFEGALNLKFSELGASHRIVRNLLSIGVITTWVLSTLLARMLLGFSWSFSLLTGAILIVTGPTVVIPLLRQIRLKSHLSSVLKWEGILNDPVGAIMAVIVFEIILTGDFNQAGGLIALGTFKSIGISVILGIIGSLCYYGLVIFRLIPKYLDIPIVFTLIVSLFTVSNVIQSESGLLTVTLMGVALANQKSVPVRHILEFNETIRVILISSLFILLAATLQFSNFTHMDMGCILFVVAQMLLVRPLAVFLSTWKTDLRWQEKIFLAWMAPRGIVAAAVSSVMALRLLPLGYEDAATLSPLIFSIIIVTITVYGLSARPLSKLLRLEEHRPQGVLFVGGDAWVIEIARALVDENHQVVVVDGHESNVQYAWSQGVPARQGNILSESFTSTIDLTGLGYMLALSPSDKTNALAAKHFSEIFQPRNVFQLSTDCVMNTENRMPESMTAQSAFLPSLSYHEMTRLYYAGTQVKTYTVPEEANLSDYWKMLGVQAVTLFIKDAATGRLRVVTGATDPRLREGDRIFAIPLDVDRGQGIALSE